MENVVPNEAISPVAGPRAVLAKKNLKKTEVGLGRMRRAVERSAGGRNPVRVAVRCRPLNDREQREGAATVVRVEGDRVCVGELRLAFDHCYGPECAQASVNADIGDAVADNACAGYNSVVFAYGKTGSGKTFTMSQLISYVLEVLLRKVGSSPPASQRGARAPSFRLEAYYFEIYNEELFDLWGRAEGGGRSKVSSKMYVNRKTGYVDLDGLGLSRKAVTSAAQMRELLRVGTKARAVASTKLNARSSRSHAILRLEFTRTEYVYREDQDCCQALDTFSCHDLVDLAGSENTKQSGASGANHAEAGKINQSLVTLQRVIEALSRLSKRKDDHAQVFVPYRDSKLTHLLKPSLGGNAKAFMIATVSPADMHAGTSTLDYARKCGLVVNHPKVNKDENEGALRQWKAEVEELSRKLRSTQAQLAAKGGHGGRSDAAAAAVAAAAAAELGEVDQAAHRQELQRKDARVAELEAQLAQERVQNELKGMELEEARSHSRNAIEACTDLKRALEQEAARAREAQAEARHVKDSVDHYKAMNKALCTAIEKLNVVVPGAGPGPGPGGDGQSDRHPAATGAGAGPAGPAGPAGVDAQVFHATLAAVARETDFVRQVAAAQIQEQEQRLRTVEKAHREVTLAGLNHVEDAAEHMDRLQQSVQAAKDRLSQAFEATDRGELDMESMQETLANTLTVMFVVAERVGGKMDGELDKLRASIMKRARRLSRIQRVERAAKENLNHTTYFSDTEADLQLEGELGELGDGKEKIDQQPQPQPQPRQQQQQQYEPSNSPSPRAAAATPMSAATPLPAPPPAPVLELDTAPAPEDANMPVAAFIQRMEDEAALDLADAGINEFSTPVSSPAHSSR